MLGLVAVHALHEDVRQSMQLCSDLFQRVKVAPPREEHVFASKTERSVNLVLVKHAEHNTYVNKHT